METGLRGKIAMISGASKGIGRAIAEKLAAEGASLSLCARSAEPLRAVAKQIEDKHGTACLAVPADLNREEDIRGWIAASSCGSSPPAPWPYAPTRLRSGWIGCSSSPASSWSLLALGLRCRRERTRQRETAARQTRDQEIRVL